MSTKDPDTSPSRRPSRGNVSLHVPDIPPKKAILSKRHIKKVSYAYINQNEDKMERKAQIRFVLIFSTIAIALIAIAIRALHNQKIAIPYPSRKIPWHEFTGLSLIFPVSILILFATCLLSLAILTANYNIKFDSRVYKKICVYSFIIGVFLHWLSLFFGVSLE